MSKILLHICCGICASHCIEKLQQDNFEVIGLFYNPNIQPEEEYNQRLEVAKTVAENFGIKLISGPYDNQNWQAMIKGLEKEPEGGRRCAICFKMRLKYTSEKANSLGIDYFTSTLSISPHKDTELINEIGRSLDPAGFREYDFKKEGGFKKAAEFAKNRKFYRQNYCGCLFSKRP
jgi:predicted adenine nucleotide alpha hydrolase (AANH) superfamily ATPase